MFEFKCEHCRRGRVRKRGLVIRRDNTIVERWICRLCSEEYRFEEGAWCANVSEREVLLLPERASSSARSICIWCDGSGFVLEHSLCRTCGGTGLLSTAS